MAGIDSYDEFVDEVINKLVELGYEVDKGEVKSNIDDLYRKVLDRLKNVSGFKTAEINRGGIYGLTFSKNIGGGAVGIDVYPVFGEYFGLEMSTVAKYYKKVSEYNLFAHGVYPFAFSDGTESIKILSDGIEGDKYVVEFEPFYIGGNESFLDAAIDLLTGAESIESLAANLADSIKELLESDLNVIAFDLSLTNAIAWSTFSYDFLFEAVESALDALGDDYAPRYNYANDKNGQLVANIKDPNSGFIFEVEFGNIETSAIKAEMRYALQVWDGGRITGWVAATIAVPDLSEDEARAIVKKLQSKYHNRFLNYIYATYGNGVINIHALGRDAYRLSAQDTAPYVERALISQTDEGYSSVLMELTTQIYDDFSEIIDSAEDVVIEMLKEI